MRFIVTPNPAKSVVTIAKLQEVNSSSLTKELALEGTAQITIYTTSNKPLKRYKFPMGDVCELNIADLKTGIYNIQVIEGKAVSNLKMIKD